MNNLEKDKIILELQQRLNKLEGLNEEGIPTYSFSKITFNDLKKCVNIKRSFEEIVFNDWFNYENELDIDDIAFLEKLLESMVNLGTVQKSVSVPIVIPKIVS